jgi:eukaryotic-like serine/threonine-protein kinase
MTAEARKQATPLPGDEEDLVAWDDSDGAQTVPPTAPEARAVGLHAGRYSAGHIVVGKYQLSAVLGEGGMGSVWLAKNRTLDVDVALKLMRAELAEEVDGVAERMLQEARAAVSIGHPAIIQVFDFGFSEFGDPFIVMELLRGESLAEAIRRRSRLRPSRAVQTLLPIADALSAAHERGIVHRDLKPENIFLSRPAGNRLQPKVLDFGIAKLEQRGAERITRDGAVIGSPAYMAPEQLRGEPGVDARADVWSLSVVLYQMITGRRPFEGDSYHASMWNVIHSEPRPISEHQIHDDGLWRILSKGLTKDVNQRFQSMRAFGRELAEWLLARGVKEDICDASLRAWLDEGPHAGEMNSFFPSQAPSAANPESPQREVLPVIAVNPEASSGTRRIGAIFEGLGGVISVRRPTTAQQASLKPSANRRLLLGTALAALLAFIGAAVWGATSSSDEGGDAVDAEPARAPSPRRAPTRTVSPPPAEDRAPSKPAVTANPPIEESAPPSREQRELSPQAPAPRRPVRPAPRRTAPKSELKNPFG